MQLLRFREALQKSGRAALAVAAPVLALLVAATPSAAQCGYEVTAIIEGPDCGFWGNAAIEGLDLNEQGHIVGRYTGVAGPDHAFAWYGAGPVVDLPPPPNTADSRAAAIDDDRCIIGSAVLSGTDLSSVGFWTDGQSTEINMPPVRVGARSHEYVARRSKRSLRREGHLGTSKK